MDTLYKHIVNDLESEIISNKYKASRKLPSVRELAVKYNCSKNTVIKAFEELKNKHIIYSVPQSGYYIVEEIIPDKKLSNTIIDFSSGNPRINDLHIPDLKHCLDRAVDIYGNMSLSDNLYGIESLRRLLPNYLADFQIFTKSENIFVNLGIQQVLSLLTQMPFGNEKDVILIEEPTYSFFANFLRFCGVKTLIIERDEDGIDLEKLEYIFKYNNIKFFYVVTRNHNPLGTSLEKYQRVKIAELAKKYDVYIVEDDYFGDLELNGKYDPIYSYGDHYHHIYLRSYSKILPWIRIGLSVIPTQLLEIFKKHIRYSYFYSYFSPSLVSQATLEIYIKSNLLKKHSNSLKKELAERSKVLLEFYDELNNRGINCIGGNSGFYSYIELPSHINRELLYKKLKNQNIIVSNGKNYFSYEEKYKKGIRISIAKTNKEDIKKGMEIISENLIRLT